MCCKRLCLISLFYSLCCLAGLLIEMASPKAKQKVSLSSIIECSVSHVIVLFSAILALMAELHAALTGVSASVLSVILSHCLWSV